MSSSRSAGWGRSGRRRSSRKRLWTPRHCSGFWQHRVISREVVDDIDVSIQGRSPGFLGFVFRWLAFVAESVAVRGSGERSGVRARFFCFGTVFGPGQNTKSVECQVSP